MCALQPRIDDRQRAHLGARPPEEPALPEPCAERTRALEVGGRLDALAHQQRARLLGVRVDGVHDRGDLRTGALLDQAQVELHDLGPKQGHEGERARIGTHVVDREGPAVLADAVGRAQQLCRTGGDAALGDLEHHRQMARRGDRDVEQVVQRRAVEHLGLDVDEDGQGSQPPRGDGRAQRLLAARRVELGQHALLPRRREQRGGILERAADRPAGERLVADHRGAIEVDDRLEDGTQAPGVEQRTHGGARDHCAHSAYSYI